MNDLFKINDKPIRRDGDLWCLTDLWRADGANTKKRPNDFLSKEGKTFVEFLRDSLDTALGGITKTRKIGGGGGETWAHWQIALAYAKWLSPEFHARVNDVYRAFMAGLLVPRAISREAEELIEYKLRVQALESANYESVWSLELQLELARLRKVKWQGAGPHPKGLTFAYGRTWRIILGDKVYEALKRRNPEPRSGTLHGQWLHEQAAKIARKQDLVIALFVSRRSTRWTEYENEMRAHFRRAPIQLRLVARGGA